MTDQTTTYLEHPIVALATPLGVSAISMFRVSGRNCIYLLSQLCVEKEKLRSAAANTTYPYRLIDPRSKEPLERAMITVYYAPRSYTGEDSAEISIHGGLAGIERMLDVLNHLGFENAEPGEFTKRAFLHDKLDLTQAEALHELIQAQSHSDHIEALQKMGGSVLSFVNKIKNDLLGPVAACHVSLDYAEDEIQESVEIQEKDIAKAIEKIDQLLVGFKLSQLRESSTKVVLVGRTNAGKSSLFNALLKADRAIVSNEHGTTRDFLETSLMLGDIPITLYDGAGFRDKSEEHAKGSVEQEGIARSRDIAAHASILIYVVDLFVGWTESDTQHVQELVALHKASEGAAAAGGAMSSTDNAAKTAATAGATTNARVPFRILVVWNKIDAREKEAFNMRVPSKILQEDSVSDLGLCISAKKHSGLDSIQEALYQCLVSEIQMPDQNMPLLSSLYQKQCLERCRESLVHVQEGLVENVPLDMISLDLDQALAALANLTGESYTEDILERVFSDFCLGK